MTRPVLVTYDTYMGGTAGIARVITHELVEAGIDVDLRPASEVHSLAGYRAVIIGSPIYRGHWRHDTLRLLRHHQHELRNRQVWLFQSGLSVITPGADPDPTPAEVRGLASAIRVAGPVATFGGRLTRETARGLLPRLMARRSVGVGDFRDMDKVAEWARSVAADLGPAVAAGPRAAATAPDTGAGAD